MFMIHTGSVLCKLCKLNMKLKWHMEISKPACRLVLFILCSTKQNSNFGKGKKVLQYKP